MNQDVIKTVNIYTDGSCYNGEGGWSYIQLDEPLGAIVREDIGAVDDTTNNRMEMVAAIKAISSLPGGTPVRVYTDSGYLKDGFHNPGYLKKWMQNGWKTSKKKPVENIDLWQAIFTLSLIYDIQFVHIKGHNDKNMTTDKHAKYNYIVDKLCAYQNVRSLTPVNAADVVYQLNNRYNLELGVRY